MEADHELLNSNKKTAKFTLEGSDVFAKCVYVTDGDTAHFTWRTYGALSNVHRHVCRLRGYNSAELHGKTAEEREQAIRSKRALEDLILDKIVQLRIGPNDKWGRPLVDVTIKYNAQLFEPDLNVSEWMISNGYGVPYNGRGEKKW